METHPFRLLISLLGLLALASPDARANPFPYDASGYYGHNFSYTLESATNIPATTWNPVTNNALMNGDLFTVQLDTSGPQRLYRLRK